MWFLLTAALTLADPKPADLKPAEVFKQLDRFDSLATAKLPFVKVATGHWSRYGDDPPANHYRYGFLLSEKDGAFTVRYLDLTQGTLRPTPEGTEEHERVGHTPQDMAELAREFARRLKLAEEDGGFDYYLNPSRPMDPRGEAVMLARACEQRGLKAERELIWKSLRHVEVDVAVGEVADGLANRLVMDFVNPELSHEQLLARHRLWLEEFKDQYHAKWVTGRVDELQKIVTENITRTKLPVKKPAEETPEDLIFALRNEYHHVLDRHFDGYFLSTTLDKKDDRPAARLSKLGLKAAPALIAALDDETPTRCVWYHSRYGGGMWTISVGEMASELLTEISGLTFYGEVPERREAWKRWLKSAQEKGEAVALAEVVAAGGDSSAIAARRLLAGWPGAIEPILTGVRKAERSSVRDELIQVLATSKAEAATGFFLEELRIGPYLGARVTAAKALLARDRREGIELFMKFWERPEDLHEKQDPGVPTAVAGFDQWIATSRARSDMAEFLLTCGEPAAVALVTKDILKQPAELRDTILSILWDDSLEEFTARSTAPHKPEVEKYVEDTLVQLLDDLEIRHGSFWRSVDGRSISFSDPRHADIAAETLQTYWPDRYQFDPSGPARLRDRRLVALKNTWRARRGLPELPVPKPAEVKTRLQNRVTEVLLTDEAKAIPAKVRELANSATEKDLTAKGFLELLLAATAALPHQQGEVILTADRLGDGAGVCLQLQMRPAPKPEKDANNVHSNISIVANNRSLVGSFGNGGRSSYDSLDDYDDEIKAINKALLLPDEQTFEFRIELRIE